MQKTLLLFCLFYVLPMHSMDVRALHDACYSGNMSQVQTCIDYGADVNQKNKYGITPLMMAVQMHNQAIPAQTYYDIVTLLISVGAKPELTADDGRTTIHFCTQNTGGTPTKIAMRKNIKKLLEYHATIF